jgi:alpha-amylase
MASRLSEDGGVTVGRARDFAAGALGLLLALLSGACQKPERPATPPGDAVGPALRATSPEAARFWNAATVYFLLTDRFQNGNPANDTALGRRKDAALYRGFEGGDLVGVRQRLEQGYFDSLGVTAIWLTPWVEQVRGFTDEGSGKTYAYHGYWIRDWTAVDPALGTEDDLRALVDAAHARGIRIIMDAVLNHTGPVTAQDSQWPDDWVRTEPQCVYRDYASTVDCTLVKNLPDIRTERIEPVELPPFLLEKWQAEGRAEAEVAALDAFFQRTGFPRAPRYYLIKWLTDWVREFGVDGYRIDTAKHFGEAVATELRTEADSAYAEWRRTHPGKAPDSLPFYVVGEVYGYGPGGGREYDFGDRKVDYFAHGFDGLINFAFKADAARSLDSVFAWYATALTTGPLRGVTLLNYVSSHDDGGPLDPERKDPLGTGTRLLLAPGAAQIYYGDELARPLRVPGAGGDANLRSPMNWADLGRGGKAGPVLAHWRKLGRFRRAHPAIGAGVHRPLQSTPYVFARILEADSAVADRVVIGLDLPMGRKAVPVGEVFAEGTEVVDAYSGARTRVKAGAVALNTPFRIVLLATP